MEPRERKLALAAGAMVLLAGSWLVGSAFYGAVAARQTRLTGLREEVAGKRDQINKGRAAETRLTAWQKLSLPFDREAALAQYKTWLTGIVERAKLAAADVTPNTTGHPRSSRLQPALDRLSFKVQGTGSLEQITQLLYDLYQGPYLHEIKTLSIKPESASKLQLSLTVEAAALRGTPTTAATARRPADRLALDSLAKYREAIVGRNLFAEYNPPPPPVVRREPTKTVPKPSFDPARFAVLSAIVEAGGRPQAWITVRTTGKTLQLYEGDPIEVGQLKGRVEHIGARDMELVSEGKRLRIPLGQTLSTGSTPPASTPSPAAGL